MLTTTYMDSKLVLSVQLIPAVAAITGLGPLVVLCPEGALPLAEQYAAVANADAVADLLTDTAITADGAAQLEAAFSQDYVPTSVYVATYDPDDETPDDAMDRLVAAGVDVQVVVPATVTDADLAALGAWLATGTRRWLYVVVAESRLASLIASGKPSALEDCEVSSFRLLYGATAQGLAGAAGGRLQGRSLTRGPTAAEVRILGVDLPGITPAEAAFAKANDVGALYPLDAGAGATERIIRGTTAYSGDSFTAVISLLYAVRQMTAALQALVERKAILGDTLLATAVGAAEVQAALVGPLSALFDQGHFVAGTSGTAPNDIELPRGYRVTAAVVGDEIVASVLLRLGQEVDVINLSVTGEIVT